MVLNPSLNDKNSPQISYNFFDKFIFDIRIYKRKFLLHNISSDLDFGHSLLVLSLSLKKLGYLKTIEKVFKSESRHKKNVRRLLCYFMIFDLV